MLVQLCASHIDSIARFNALQRQLYSTSQQTVKAPLYLSISTCPKLSAFVHANLTTTTNMRIYWRAEKLSQFEHYALLSRELEKDTWCLFLDDDDYCNPIRVESYLNTTLSNNTTTICFCDSVLNIYNEAKAELNSGGDEYWMYATKSDILEIFFSNIPTETLKLESCDLIFRNFLRATLISYSKSPVWLYAKIMDSQFDHVSLRNPDLMYKMAVEAYTRIRPDIPKWLGVSKAIVDERMYKHYWYIEKTN